MNFKKYALYLTLFTAFVMVFSPRCSLKAVTRSSPLPENSKNIPAGPQWPWIDSLSVSSQSFNPSQKEMISLSFFAKTNANFSVNIIDEDGFPVRRLLLPTPFPIGARATCKWDGRDDGGEVVPDEAYFPLIFVERAGKIDTINPVLRSGGKEISGLDVRYEAREKAITYRINGSSRMLVRAGIEKGALLATIVDMQPRAAGAVSEYWNGRDADNLSNLMETGHNVSVAVFGYELPRPAIISYGNAGNNYAAYRLRHDTTRGKHFVLPHDTALGRASSIHFRQPRVADHAPRVFLDFLQSEKTDSSGAPVLKGKSIVRVAIDKNDVQFLDEQFEITFFLDNSFFTEEEVGYLPYNMVWDVSGLSPGNHVLTVNVSSFKDRIGVKRARIVVQ